MDISDSSLYGNLDNIEKNISQDNKDYQETSDEEIDLYEDLDNVEKNVSQGSNDARNTDKEFDRSKNLNTIKNISKTAKDVQKRSSAQDFNLYEECLIVKENEKKEKERAELNAKWEDNEKEQNRLKERCEFLEQDNKTLMRNISSLWKTSIAQLRDKDKKIAALHKEKELIIFRRIMRQISKDEIDKIVSRITAYNKEDITDLVKVLKKDETPHTYSSYNPAITKVKYKNDNVIRNTVLGTRVNEKSSSEALLLQRFHGQAKIDTPDSGSKKTSKCINNKRHKSATVQEDKVQFMRIETDNKEEHDVPSTDNETIQDKQVELSMDMPNLEQNKELEEGEISDSSDTNDQLAKMTHRNSEPESLIQEMKCQDIRAWKIPKLKSKLVDEKENKIEKGKISSSGKDVKTRLLQQHSNYKCKTLSERNEIPPHLRARSSEERRGSSERRLGTIESLREDARTKSSSPRDRESRSQRYDDRRSRTRSNDRDSREKPTYQRNKIVSPRKKMMMMSRNKTREGKEWEMETSFLVEKLREKKVREGIHKRSFSRQPHHNIYKMRRKRREEMEKYKVDRYRTHKRRDRSVSHQERRKVTNHESSSKRESNERRNERGSKERRTDKESKDLRTDKESEEQRTDKESKDQKTDKNSKEHRIDNDSKDQRTDKESNEQRSNKESKKQRTDKESKEHRINNDSKDQRTDKESNEQRSNKESKKQRTDKESKEHRIDNDSKDQRTDKESNEQRSNKESKKQKTDKESKEHRTDNDSKDQRSEKESNEHGSNKESRKQRTDKESKRQRSKSGSKERQGYEELKSQTERDSIEKTTEKRKLEEIEKKKYSSSHSEKAESLEINAHTNEKEKSCNKEIPMKRSCNENNTNEEMRIKRSSVEHVLESNCVENLTESKNLSEKTNTDERYSKKMELTEETKKMDDNFTDETEGLNQNVKTSELNFRGAFNLSSSNISANSRSSYVEKGNDRELFEEGDTLDNLLLNHKKSYPSSLSIQNDDSEMSLLRYIDNRSEQSPDKSSTFIAISPPPFVMPILNSPSMSHNPSLYKETDFGSQLRSVESSPRERKDVGEGYIQTEMESQQISHSDHLSPVCLIPLQGNFTVPTPPIGRLPYSLLTFQNMETPPKTLTTSSCSPIPVATPLDSTNDITATCTPPPLSSTLKSSTPVIVFDLDKKSHFARNTLPPLVRQTFGQIGSLFSNNQDMPESLSSIQPRRVHCNQITSNSNSSETSTGIHDIQMPEKVAPSTSVISDDSTFSHSKSVSLQDSEDEDNSLVRKKKVPFLTLSKEVSKSFNEYKSFGYASSFYKNLDKFEQEWPACNKYTHSSQVKYNCEPKVIPCEEISQKIYQEKITHSELSQEDVSQGETFQNKISTAKVSDVLPVEISSENIPKAVLSATSSTSTSNNTNCNSCSSSSRGSSSSNSSSSTCSTCSSSGSSSSKSNSSNHINSENNKTSSTTSNSNSYRTNFTNSLLESPKNQENHQSSNPAIEKYFEKCTPSKSSLPLHQTSSEVYINDGSKTSSINTSEFSHQLKNSENSSSPGEKSIINSKHVNNSPKGSKPVKKSCITPNPTRKSPRSSPIKRPLEIPNSEKKSPRKFSPVKIPSELSNPEKKSPRKSRSIKKSSGICSAEKNFPSRSSPVKISLDICSPEKKSPRRSISVKKSSGICSAEKKSPSRSSPVKISLDICSPEKKSPRRSISVKKSSVICSAEKKSPSSSPVKISLDICSPEKKSPRRSRSVKKSSGICSAEKKSPIRSSPVKISSDICSPEKKSPRRSRSVKKSSGICSTEKKSPIRSSPVKISSDICSPEKKSPRRSKSVKKSSGICSAEKKSLRVGSSVKKSTFRTRTEKITDNLLSSVKKSQRSSTRQKYPRVLSPASNSQTFIPTKKFTRSSYKKSEAKFNSNYFSPTKELLQNDSQTSIPIKKSTRLSYKKSESKPDSEYSSPAKELLQNEKKIKSPSKSKRENIKPSAHSNDMMMKIFGSNSNSIMDSLDSSSEDVSYRKEMENSLLLKDVNLENEVLSAELQCKEDDICSKEKLISKNQNADTLEQTHSDCDSSTDETTKCSSSDSSETTTDSSTSDSSVLSQEEEEEEEISKIRQNTENISDSKKNNDLVLCSEDIPHTVEHSITASTDDSCLKESSNETSSNEISRLVESLSVENRETKKPIPTSNRRSCRITPTNTPIHKTPTSIKVTTPEGVIVSRSNPFIRPRSLTPSSPCNVISIVYSGKEAAEKSKSKVSESITSTRTSKKRKISPVITNESALKTISISQSNHKTPVQDLKSQINPKPNDLISSISSAVVIKRPIKKRKVSLTASSTSNVSVKNKL